MKTFSPEEEKEVLDSLKKALTKAAREGQPVKRLAEEAAQGGRLRCEFVACADGREQLVIWVEAE